ncbi:MAG TPA: DUF4349 domain-containing protein, partial [Candidatus Limnocylindria bacterium]|nr:DUF4349 domain-containing protein [Candidatus Limnocylindria bacterium]
MKRFGWLLPAILLLAACSGAQSTASGPATRGGGSSAEFAVGKPAAVNAGAPQPAESVSNGVPVPQAFDVTRSVILTANIAMKASDPWAVADKAQAVAAGLGGDVIGLSQSGSKDDRVASLTIRVPSERFTEALRQLRALDGDVLSSTVEGKDVTDQFVDLKARLSAKQGEEQRYNALLTRAGTIDEILKIDAALSNVRTQIEQLQGQVNSISSRTQFSTITMSITPALVPVGTTPSAWDPARTVAVALATLAAVLRGFADVAIWLLVFGWIPLLALAVALIVTRGRRT